MHRAYEKVVISASVPSRTELCCVVGQINFDEVQESSAKSNFHWQTIKCRLIIYTMPEVIASPVIGTEGDIYIVTTRTFFKTGRMQTKLKNMYIMFSNPKQITSEVYEACLRYTIVFKIAPLWLKLGEYLLQGPMFVPCTEIMSAIRMNLSINDQEAYFELHPARVKIAPLKLADFYFSEIDIASFMADLNGYINMEHFGKIWVHVLPSMKKGLLMAISKEIPATCPFRNYHELRRHWKNMYGYRLPKSDEDIIYFQIYFHLIKPALYTYPNICVRSGPLDFLHSDDHESSVDKFLQDLNKTIPEVLNRRLQFSESRGQFVAKLYKLDGIIQPLVTREDISRANFVNASYQCASSNAGTTSSVAVSLQNIQNSKRSLPFSTTCTSQQIGNTSLNERQNSNLSLGNISTLMSPTPSMSCCSDATPVTTGVKSSQIEQICASKQQLDSKNALSLNAWNIKQENKHTLQRSIDSGLASQCIGKSIPSQQSRVNLNQSAHNKKLNFHQGKNRMFYIPSCDEKTNDIPVKDERSILDSTTKKKNDETKAPIPSPFFEKDDLQSVGGMSDKKFDSREFSTPNLNVIKQQRYSGHQIQIQDVFFRPEQCFMFTTSTAPMEVEEKAEIKKHVPIFQRKHPSTKKLKTPTIQQTTSLNQQGTQNGIRSHANQNKENLTKHFKEKKLAKDTKFKKPQSTGILNTQGEPSTKKLVQSVLSIGRSGVIEVCKEPKKRKKMANVDNMDIEKMANENNLDHATVVTLRSWLMKHSVPYKKHDKKIELIAKVITYLAQEGKLGEPE